MPQPFGLPLLHVQKHTADKTAAVSGSVRILAVQCSANGGNGDIELSNSLTDSGDQLVYNVLDGDTLFFDYSALGGVAFNVGLTVDITANTTVIIWTDQGQATA